MTSRKRKVDRHVSLNYDPLSFCHLQSSFAHGLPFLPSSHLELTLYHPLVTRRTFLKASSSMGRDHSLVNQPLRGST